MTEYSKQLSMLEENLENVLTLFAQELNGDWYFIGHDGAVFLDDEQTDVIIQADNTLTDLNVDFDEEC